MGDDGYGFTDGYLSSDDIPSFKIYDASDDVYYDAIPSEQIPWNSSSLEEQIDTLNAQID